MVPALLKWIGNKQRFAAMIVSHMPDTFHDYYEPFLGSGAVMAELLSQDARRPLPRFGRAYGSDILPFLIDIFQIVKDRPDALSDYYAEEISAYYGDPDGQYLRIRDRFNQDHNAFDFCLLSRTCYSGVIRFRRADGYMSTPRGPHRPIAPETFRRRVSLWSDLLRRADFRAESFETAMNRAQPGDVVYCDPPYPNSQSIIYGAQEFDLGQLWNSVAACRGRGVFVMLSISGTGTGGQAPVEIPAGLFEREVPVNCGISMIDRLRSADRGTPGEMVQDRLLLTW